MRCTVTDQGPHAGPVRRFPAGPRCHAHRPGKDEPEKPAQVEPVAPPEMDAAPEARDQPNPEAANRKRSPADVDAQGAILAELERHDVAALAERDQHAANLRAIKDRHGLTYADVGDILGGISRQAAHQRLNP